MVKHVITEVLRSLELAYASLPRSLRPTASKNACRRGYKATYLLQLSASFFFCLLIISHWDFIDPFATSPFGFFILICFIIYSVSYINLYFRFFSLLHSCNFSTLSLQWRRNNAIKNYIQLSECTLSTLKSLLVKWDYGNAVYDYRRENTPVILAKAGSWKF